MDFSGALGNLNWWAVLVSIGAVMLVGALWYSNLLFGKAWVASAGKTRLDLQQGRSMLWLMLTTFVWTALIVITIGLLEQFIGIIGWYDGIGLGLLVGFGLVVSTSTIHSLFENKWNSLVWITAGHNILICVIPAVILASWR